MPPGVLDDLLDFLSGAKVLRKAAGQEEPSRPTPAKPSKPEPAYGQQGMSKLADEAAAQQAAKKVKQQPKQSPKRPGVTSYGDSSGYNFRDEE